MRKLDPTRTILRVNYYIHSFAAELVPHAYFARCLEASRGELASVSVDTELLSLFPNRRILQNLIPQYLFLKVSGSVAKNPVMGERASVIFSEISDE